MSSPSNGTIVDNGIPKTEFVSLTPPGKGCQTFRYVYEWKILTAQNFGGFRTSVVSITTTANTGPTIRSISQTTKPPAIGINASKNKDKDCCFLYLNRFTFDIDSQI